MMLIRVKSRKPYSDLLNSIGIEAEPQSLDTDCLIRVEESYVHFTEDRHMILLKPNHLHMAVVYEPDEYMVLIN